MDCWRHCLISQRNDLLFELLRSLRVSDLVDYDVCSLSGKFERDGLAYAVVSAGHDGNFVL